ncbi:cardiolipin synthase [Virgibacillus siamensis]|uniref:Cardiolipin synthase n=1 Tax=Virgibacillus siamensis TaxID=480071 RepID=A0ABN1GCQ6_9BACI
MKQKRQLFFIILLTITFYLAFLSEATSLIRIGAFVAYLLLVFCISYALMLENRSPYKTLLWIYLIVFVPVFGYAFFIYSGQLQVRGHLFQRKRKSNQMYLKQVSKKNSFDSWISMDGDEKFISNMIAKESKFPINFSSDTTVLKDGEETFAAIKNQLIHAKQYIHLEYYTLRDDQIGMEIINILVNKSMLGLEVKVIYDGVGSASLSKGVIRKLKAAGVEIACFLPLKSGLFNQKINFRNHRKIIVVDGEIAFVGGLNIGDEYLSRDSKIGFWRDTHVKLKGEAIRSLHTIFLGDWTYLTNEVLDIKTYPTQPLNKNDLGGVQVLGSGPDANQGIMSELYFNMIVSAKRSLWIATPYFVPNKDIRTALSMAAKKGIDVKLMVPAINDGFLTQYATRSYFGELLDNGIDVYLYQKGFMHQKIMIVDGQFATTGTANVDFRSLNLNFEVNVFLFHTKSVTNLVENFTEDIRHCRKVESETYHNRGFIVQSKESLARLFSPVL